MKTILICPSPRPGVSFLAETAPLSNWPVFGKSLIEHWIEHQATLGAKQVLILASDRPDQVRRIVGNGAKWGVHAEIFPERFELTPEQARSKYRGADAAGWLREPHDVVLMDHLPRVPDRDLFAGYSEWISVLQNWMPCAATPDRIGVTQRQPGIWMGSRTRVASDVTLRPPVWLGENVYLGPGSVIGPNVILEDRAFVEGPAKIEESLVGPETFVGALSELVHSIAWGEALINWKNGSSSCVPDAYVLSGLGRGRDLRKGAGPAGRIAGLIMMALTLPWGLISILRSRFSAQPAFRKHIAVRALGSERILGRQPVVYYELENARGWMRRWPQLWNVVRGEFAWVGNRPLKPDQADQLTNEFERLWLAAPIGLFSLADALGCIDTFDDETRAHASFYAVQANWRWDWSILNRALAAPCPSPIDNKVKEVSSSLVSTSLIEAEK